MNTFRLKSPYTPTGDQPEAIDALTRNFLSGAPEQVLLGVTGSGKTFTMANLIANLNKPTLIISHNKTLAAQLYQEFRDFFPENAVSYFVSYYDYYQPEAYVPQTDTYIEKTTEINEEIDKLRLAATANILTRRDTIVVASVSCIYNIGSPREYGHFVLELAPGAKIDRKNIFDRLIQLQYERSEYGFHRSTFRARGETIDIFPAYEDKAIRVIINGSYIQALESIDPLTGKVEKLLEGALIYPAKHYMTDPKSHKNAFEAIQRDMEQQVALFKKQNKLIEAQRIRQKVEFDLEMITEMGYVNGIENYSRYFDGRNPGDPPYSLFDYFSEAMSMRSGTKGNDKDWLLLIDESHMTMPQIRGMYNGDRARKQTLIDYGFRLPSALDNRPLRDEEFMRRIPQTLYVSATPNDWEIERVGGRNTTSDTKPAHSLVVEQLIRPTGLVDPTVTIRPIAGQVDDVYAEILKRKEKKERVLVTTLTKRMSEDLTKYLEEKGVLVQYLHSDVETLKRTDILSDLRRGTFDVLVGINLLREGLDLPEVSLVAILDADREGFLRSRTSLIQTMGRAARHVQGEVILYADTITDSIKNAVSEVERRRAVQLVYNKTHGITPEGIKKAIRAKLVEESESEKRERREKRDSDLLSMEHIDAMTPKDKESYKKKLTKIMRQASRDLNFEYAAKLRDRILSLDT